MSMSVVGALGGLFQASQERTLMRFPLLASIPCLALKEP